MIVLILPLLSNPLESIITGERDGLLRIAKALSVFGRVTETHYHTIIQSNGELHLEAPLSQ